MNLLRIYVLSLLKFRQQRTRYDDVVQFIVVTIAQYQGRSCELFIAQMFEIA